jgi:hypothetical protein
MTMPEQTRKAQLYTWLTSELAGSTRDGSETTIRLYQDDATHTKHVQVGKKDYWGNTWGQAIQKAHDDFNQDTDETDAVAYIRASPYAKDKPE